MGGVDVPKRRVTSTSLALPKALLKVLGQALGS
jgi:hypothetical protein